MTRLLSGWRLERWPPVGSVVAAGAGLPSGAGSRRAWEQPSSSRLPGVLPPAVLWGLAAPGSARFPGCQDGPEQPWALPFGARCRLASRSPCFCPLCCPSPGSAAAKPEPCLTESQVPHCRRRGAVAVLSLLDGPGFVPHVGAAPASRGAALRCGDRVERGRYRSPAPARGVWGRSVGQP